MSPDSQAQAPWYRVPVDAVLVVSCVIFFLTSVTSDRAAGLDLISPDSADFFGRNVYAYGIAIDPIVAANPMGLRVMSWISGFIFGPFYLVVAYAIVKRRNWIRMPAIIYVACMYYSLVVHAALEFMWVDVSPQPALLTAIYLPYYVIPGLLAWRMRRPRPFA